MFSYYLFLSNTNKNNKTLQIASMQNGSLKSNNKQSSYFLGIDVGTSFIKVALIDSRQQVIQLVRTPETEMKIYSQKDFYCEQDPEEWWRYVCQGTRKLYSKHEDVFKQKLIKGIGISYQMHGLVLVDEDHHVLRRAIIWSDGRTNQIGNRLKELAQKHNLKRNMLNDPGNFTISKLKWVQENQPHIYNKIYKILLPGDFIALRLSGKCRISETGLSEAILWDFKQNKLNEKLLQICEISKDLIPQVVSSFSFQGQVNQKGSIQSMIPQSTPILYRSGDQPNNAYTLNVTELGEVAASGGTSGTVLLVSDFDDSQELSRINTFLHVSHTKTSPRYAKLLCINSCGIVYNWLKSNFASNMSYQDLNTMAQACQSQGLMVMPFGNGLQRMLSHTNIKASIRNIDLNRHGLKHIIRASLQSIAFSFIYGINILSVSQHMNIRKIKCSNDNIFNCRLIVEIIESVVGCEMRIVEGVTGAVGCAKGAMETWKKLYGNEKKDSHHDHGHRKQSFEEEYALFRAKKENLQEKSQKYLKIYKAWEKQLQKCLIAEEKELHEN